MRGGGGETRAFVPPPQPNKRNASAPAIPRDRKMPTTSTLLRERSACWDSTGWRNLCVTAIEGSSSCNPRDRSGSTNLRIFCSVLVNGAAPKACYLKRSSLAGKVLLHGVPCC